MEWNFTYENQEASSFLVYQLEKSEQLDTVGMGMLSNNQIPHILPLLYTQIDEERYLRYAIPGRIPLGDYLEEALVLAKQGGFTVMGHLTLPLRYFNEMRGFHTSFDPYEEQIREILKTLIENGRGIELNCNRGNQPLPDGKWLKIYRELGGEVITLGTDAHSTQHVGCSVRERQALLKSCGFTRFCTFEKQKPIWHAL